MTLVDRRIRRLVLVLVSAVLLAVARPALADVDGCPGDANQPRHKILIGSVGDLADTVGTRLTRRLVASFEMRFERARTELEKEALVIYCDRRRIRNKDAYSETVVGLLNEDQVLLEVGAQKDGSDINVTFVVIPVRFYHYFRMREERNSGYYAALYDQSRISVGLEKLFKDNEELRLMTALALALRYEKLAHVERVEAERARLFDRARAFYCDAFGSAEASRPNSSELGLSEQEWQNLRELARGGAEALFRRALGTVSYTGALRAVASERAGAPESAREACVLQQSGGGR
jgi:hypothetical protein